MALTNAEHQRRWREKRNRLAKEAEAMRQTPRRRGRRARPIDDANAFIGELFDFRLDFGRRLTAWRDLARFSDEDRDQLVAALHGTANELSILAQQLAGLTSGED
jgi:hypothetical protein